MLVGLCCQNASNQLSTTSVSAACWSRLHVLTLVPPSHTHTRARARISSLIALFRIPICCCTLSPVGFVRRTWKEARGIVNPILERIMCLLFARGRTVIQNDNTSTAQTKAFGISDDSYRSLCTTCFAYYSVTYVYTSKYLISVCTIYYLI